MSNALLHSTANKSVLSRDRDNQVQWERSGEAWVQSEFETSETFTQARGDKRGIKTFVRQISFVGSWMFGQIYIPDDSHLWGKFPYVWKNGKEKPESSSDYTQTEIWPV